jgi:hypothetical protein
MPANIVFEFYISNAVAPLKKEGNFNYRIIIISDDS